MRIDESAEPVGSFDDGYGLNPESKLQPTAFYAPEAVLEAQGAQVVPEMDEPGTLLQSELDLRSAQSGEKITEGQSISPTEASLRRLGRDRRAMICVAIILIMVTASYIVPMFYLQLGPVIQGGVTGTSQVPPQQYHYMTHQELLDLDAPGSAAHPLGTDQLGRDILARLMAGVNVSIQVALFVEIFDVVLGVFWSGSWRASLEG